MDDFELEKKYRPAELNSVLGNKTAAENLAQTLEQYSSGQNPKRTFLITGSRGTGKTTLARAFARELKATEENGDYMEINTTQLRGIDTSRAIERQVHFRPQGRARVWLIDEVHQMSGAGQEGLLKTIEEPKSYAFFFLCTTEPDKLKNTLKSRCAKLKTAAPEPAVLAKYLQRIARKEKVRIDENSCRDIAQLVEGNPREGLIMLGQVLSATGGDRKQTRNMIKELQEHVSEGIELCRLLMKKNVNWKQIAGTIKGLSEEPERLRQGVLAYAKSCILNGSTEAYFVLDAFREPCYDAPWPKLITAAYEAHIAMKEED